MEKINLGRHIKGMLVILMVLSAVGYPLFISRDYGTLVKINSVIVGTTTSLAGFIVGIVYAQLKEIEKDRNHD